MDRIEALQAFRRGKAKEICEKKHREIYRFFWDNKKSFEEKLRSGLAEIIEKTRSDQDDTPIGFIEFSFLRVHILDGSYQWLVEAQDENGSFDMADRTISIDMSGFFGIWEELKEELKKEALCYVNILTEADCEQIVLEEFDKLQLYFLLMGIHAFTNIDQSEVFSKLNKARLFRIIMGERRGKVQLIYASNQSSLAPAEIINKLCSSEGEEDYISKEFVLGDFNGFVVSDCRIAIRNLSFSNFNNAKIKGAEILVTQFIAANLDEIVIEDCQIDLCVFLNSSFCKAQIENTNFAGCSFGGQAEDELIEPVLYPVLFDEANISNVSFAGCDLRYCDFSKANLEDVDFVESLLEGACFSKRIADTLDLTEEQRKGIRLI